MVMRCRATSRSTPARCSTGTRSTSTPASSMGIETVVQDLALASHPNPAQNMCRGRETPASGLFRVHGHQGHAGPIEGGIRRPWPRPSAATAIRGRHGRWPATGDRRRPCPRLSQGGPARRAHRGARVSDRVQVLRLGRRVATSDTNDTTVGRLVGAINVHRERPMTQSVMCKSTSKSHVLEFRR